MCENDSFNDSDEMFQLYSFKNVTKTYKDQLKKLMSDSAYSPEKLLKVDNHKYDLEELNLNLTPEIDNLSSLKVVESEGNESCNSPDVIEIEVTPKESPRLRRSSRLQKRSLGKSDSNSQNVILPLSTPKVKKKKRQKRKVDESAAEEVIIDDSIDLSENIEEEVNPELSVKVIWKSITIKKFTIRKFQKMSKIYQDLSKEENIPENRIILTFKNSKVNFNDTPSSLNLQVFDFLEGGTLSDVVSQNNTKTNENIEYSQSSVVLQFQDSSKHVIKIGLDTNDKLKIAMIKYSEQLEIDLKNIKFCFDGELLNPSDTPASLGLENDDIIDIKIIENKKN